MHVGRNDQYAIDFASIGVDAFRRASRRNLESVVRLVHGMFFLPNDSTRTECREDNEREAQRNLLPSHRPWFCPTSKMSHDGSWRELCPSWGHGFENQFSTARDSSRRWLWRLVRLFFIVDDALHFPLGDWLKDYRSNFVDLNRTLLADEYWGSMAAFREGERYLIS
jgi:hypothetical protein